MLAAYDFVLAAAMLRIFGSNDERRGLAGVYTFNSYDRYFEKYKNMKIMSNN